MTPRVDMIGKKFGRLLVIGLSKERGSRGQLKYICKCDCGQIKHILGESLRSSKCQSCGCLNREITSAKMKTHGGSSSRLYHVWQGIKNRCLNPNSPEYYNYGGRGITICDEWLDFDNFRVFMLSIGYNSKAAKGAQTIERIDVNKGYFPDNCTLIPLKQQPLNMTSNRKIRANNQTKLLTEWARELEVSETTIINRIKRGWSPEKAVTTPPKRVNKYTVGNETHTTKEWATIMGIPWSTLRDRMRRNGQQEELERLVKDFYKS